jgi:hypothetical protein
MSRELTTLERYKGCLVGLAVGDAVGNPVANMPTEEQFAEMKSSTRVLKGSELVWLNFRDNLESRSSGIIDGMIQDPFYKMRDGQEGAPTSHTMISVDLTDPTSRHPFLFGGPLLMEVYGADIKGKSMSPNEILMRSLPAGLVWRHKVDKIDSFTSYLADKDSKTSAACQVMARALSILTSTGSFESAYNVTSCGVPRSFNELVGAWISSDLDSASYTAICALDSVRASRDIMLDIAERTKRYDTEEAFRQALLEAVNLPGRKDYNTALTGALAGACYGVSAIPKEWRGQLHPIKEQELMAGAEKLYFTNQELLVSNGKVAL